MRGVRIGALMTALNVGLVLLVAAGLVPGGVLLLRRLAAENAAARVALAAVGAAEGMRLEADEVLTSARLLAERPTLHRLASEGRDNELRDFLSTFADTSHLSGCAVVTPERRVSTEMSSVDWPAILAASGELPGSYLWSDDGTLLLGAMAPLPSSLDGVAVVIRVMDAHAMRKLEDRVGLLIRIVPRADADVGPTRLENGDWFGTSPVGIEAPGTSLEVEARLSASAVSAQLAPVERAFLLVTLLALLLAVGASAVVAKHLSRPLTKLQRVAGAIGAGDLSTPVPVLRGVEIGALAASMEGMRRKLRTTTAELARREAEATALLEGIVEGVFAVDDGRRIEYLSPQAARLLGVEIAEAVGSFCGDVLHPLATNGTRPCESACPIVNARSMGSSRSVEQLDLPGGRRSIVIASAPPTGGRQVQLIRDETDVEMARRSRDAVLANVSHELKTPLSAQLASIQLLEESLEGAAPPHSVELVSSLERSTLRLSRLIDNLLESVRIETGQDSTRFSSIDLRAVVADAESMTEPLMRQRRQEVTVVLADRLAEVAGNATQLTQVFVNLLANANKFSPEGSVIRIEGHSDSASTVITVEDAGPGIPPSERRSVFEHYYRADPGAAEGIGLGLWIVKAIVQRHGGSVEVAEAPSCGARFTVRLPRRRPE